MVWKNEKTRNPFLCSYWALSLCLLTKMWEGHRLQQTSMSRLPSTKSEGRVKISQLWAITCNYTTSEGCREELLNILGLVVVRLLPFPIKLLLGQLSSVESSGNLSWEVITVVLLNNLSAYSKRKTTIYQAKASWSRKTYREKQGDKQIRKNKIIFKKSIYRPHLIWRMIPCCWR